MTQEEKNLLIKDLCARMPDGVIAYASEINKNGIITDVNILYNMVNLDDIDSGKYELVPLFGIKPYLCPISSIKPYLRPMSSMTEEEKEEYDKTFDWDYGVQGTPFDWLNTHHFDYHGLIEKGLA